MLEQTKNVVGTQVKAPLHTTLETAVRNFNSPAECARRVKKDAIVQPTNRDSARCANSLERFSKLGKTSQAANGQPLDDEM